MNIFEHHAYFLKGGRAASATLSEILNSNGFSLTHNPDLFKEHYESFGIAESRKLRDLDSRNPVGDRKVFIISYDSITKEAQNALLKTFEEPLGNSHYYLCTDNIEELLPTLRSRMQELKVEFTETNSSEAEAFLEMTIDERFVFAAKFAEEIKKGKRSKKDAEMFFNSLEKKLYEDQATMDAKKIKDFLDIKHYISIKGSSVKNLMETVAVLI